MEARRAAVGRPLRIPIPSAPVTPIRVLEGVPFYVDPARSVAEPALKAENAAAFEPLRRFVDGIVDLADGWMVSRPAQPAYAALAMDGLWEWAAADALCGPVNQQGQYERAWTLGSLALAYVKVRGAPGLDPAKLRAVDRWLGHVAAAVEPAYERPRLASSNNNLAYWAGLAVAATGVATGDRALFDWGMVRARLGIAQIRDDGFLPLELDRRARALHYHLFALAPLVMLAELAAANGVPLYDEGHHAIERLASRVIDGLRDPSSFAAVAGAVQEVALPPRRADLAWAEAYFARFHDRRLAAWLAAARPLKDNRLGGDMTAAFGVSVLD